MDSKWAFIVNPVAGNGFATHCLGKLEENISKYNLEAEIVFTQREGHAAELSEEFAERGFNFIIGVGGDGTINEIARPLLKRDDIIIGVIPAGTGNDFIQILGFPERFDDEHWDIFFSQNIMAMDVGTVNGLSFLNGMGLGFDAEVAAQNYVAPGQVKLGSKRKYVWHILKTLLFFKEKRMTILNNGNMGETNCFINTVSIGRRFAGGFLLTPKAIANDSKLDVCSIKELSLMKRIHLLTKVPKGKHIEDEKVHYYQTDKLVLEFTEEVPFHLDGELNYASKFDVEVLPSALKAIYNPGGKHFFNV